jgi:hypothetical protein
MLSFLLEDVRYELLDYSLQHDNVDGRLISSVDGHGSILNFNLVSGLPRQSPVRLVS